METNAFSVLILSMTQRLHGAHRETYRGGTLLVAEDKALGCTTARWPSLFGNFSLGLFHMDTATSLTRIVGTHSLIPTCDAEAHPVGYLQGISSHSFQKKHKQLCVCVSLKRAHVPAYPVNPLALHMTREVTTVKNCLFSSYPNLIPVGSSLKRYHLGLGDMKFENHWPL